MDNSSKQINVSELMLTCSKNASKQFKSLGISSNTSPELAFRIYTDLLNAQLQHELMAIQMKEVSNGNK